MTTTSGLLRRAAGPKIVIEADDHRIVWYRINEKTTFPKGGKTADVASFVVGDHVNVDSTEDEQGYLTAMSVTFEKAGTPAEKAAAQTWDLPRLQGRQAASSSTPSSPQRAPGDERPVLRRKSEEPAKETASQNAPAKETAAATPEEPVDTRPTTTVRPQDPPRDQDDPGPPALRHGVPAPHRPSARASTSGGESSGGPVILSKPAEPEPKADTGQQVVAEDDPVIAKAREVAASFAGSLPNFFCQQVTTRYQSDHPKQGWDPVDVVTAEVAYENGRESYKNIRIGNKSTNKPMEDIEGTRSTGEFATILEDLLSPTTAAQFRRKGQDTIHGRATWVYKYEVTRERSHWRIEAPSQLYYPAYQGTVWIDQETGRALRIEQQSRNMPLLFPFDTVETATDYDFVRLSTPEPFLLPVDAEVLSCVRGTNTCMRNRIEFRNYRKFGAESNVTFDGKQ